MDSQRKDGRTTREFGEKIPRPHPL